MRHTDSVHTVLLADIAEHLRLLSAVFHALACRMDHLRQTTAAYPAPCDVFDSPDDTEDDPPF